MERFEAGDRDLSREKEAFKELITKGQCFCRVFISQDFEVKWKE